MIGPVFVIGPILLESTVIAKTAPVLFIDVDGCLNTNNTDLELQDGLISWPDTEDHPAKDQFQNRDGIYSPGWVAESIEVVQELRKKIGCDIVISSTWRMDMPTVDFNKYLGFTDNAVVGSTLNLGGVLPPSYQNEQFAAVRGIEIAAWLSMNHRDMLDANYVVVDDCVVSVPTKRLFLANPFTGLTKADIPTIEKMFARGHEECQESMYP